MKQPLLSILLTLCCSCVFARQESNLRLSISADGHSFQYADGKPFFWLGDTAWEMLARLDKKEISLYLQNRKAKGFNVIQTVILDDSTDPPGPNRYGDIPLTDNDPDKPNEKYFSLVDWTAQQALKKGLHIALLPTWAGNVVKRWGTPKAMFNEKNAYRYGLFLGKRYKDYPNIVWIAGGDRPAFSNAADWRPLWRAMIKGIREGTSGKALITYHPAGESSSTAFWKDENTLDFNMMQSGHRIHDLPVWAWIERDYNLKPAKPILDGEPNYEDHPINWKKENGYFNAYDVRKQLYRSVFSGAAGVTYGHHTIWQFYSPRVQPIAYPDRSWLEALDRPGAYQAGYLKSLIMSASPGTRIAEHSMLLNTGTNDTGSEHATAFRNKENSLAMIYLPVGKKIEVNVSWMAAGKIRARWFDPRTGKFQKLGIRSRGNETLVFEPATTGAENDWVLILQVIKK